MNKPLLEVKNLDLHFPVFGGVLKRPVGNVYAVNDVSFTLSRGETLGVVGESGCGKTTLGRALVRLYEPTAGEVLFDGQDITKMSPTALKDFRRKMQMVFQDPYASLNPRMTICDTLAEPLKLHDMGDKAERLKKVKEIVRKVGLRDEDINKFPHEFSGGQRQRIGIARALILNPELVIADESVSALDVSIQSQILNLLVDLQKELNLTYIFISHDLTVVKYISDRVAVMYLGRVVELARSKDIYDEPLHPYTMALIKAVPVPDPDQRKTFEALEGDVPSPKAPPPGCSFHTRCPYAKERCKRELPQLRQPAHNPDHLVACHFAEEIRAKGEVH